MRRLEAQLFASKIKACATLFEARSLHSRLAELGQDGDKFTGNHLVQKYGELGSLSEANGAFDRLKWRNVFSWTILVTAHTLNGYLHGARFVFSKMPQHNVVAANSIMLGISQSGDLSEVQRLFDSIPEPDTVAWNTLTTAYAENGDLVKAREFFLKTPDKNVVSWTAIMCAYAHAGQIDEAKSLFDDMPQRNSVSWNSLLGSYAQEGDLHACSRLFERIPHRDLVTWNSILPVYTRNGLLNDAKAIFDSIPCAPNVLSQTSMLAGYADVGLIKDARNMFLRMKARDAGAWNAMIAAYAQVGELTNARVVFDRMAGWNLRSWTSMFLAHAQLAEVETAGEVFEEMPERDLVSWNALLTAYTRNNLGERALHLFKRMVLEGVRPNGITYICVIDACSQTGALAIGRLVDEEQLTVSHALTRNQGTVELGNCFISMYSKCGSVMDARRHFESMEERDSVSWTSMITAEVAGGAGDSGRALSLFSEMVHQGVDPSGVTFLGVLSACAYSALLEAGWEYWRVMVTDYGITPAAEHYAWLVNLLARSGRLTEAEELIRFMPFEPEYTTCGALLGVCSVSGSSADEASRAARLLSDINPGSSAPYVSLANIFAGNLFNIS